MNALIVFSFPGVLVTGFLLIFAFLLKQSSDLVFARSLERLKKDRYDPRFEAERTAENSAAGF